MNVGNLFAISWSCLCVACIYVAGIPYLNEKNIAIGLCERLSLYHTSKQFQVVLDIKISSPEEICTIFFFLGGFDFIFLMSYPFQILSCLCLLL